ncbi:hypothetical protein M758_10G072000 [Ceratodon purpureus]|nr:hypothetical protein M758_10G072000 [Ceratodon purpureus]
MKTKSRGLAPPDAKQDTLYSRVAEKREMNENPTPKHNEIATTGRSRRAQAYPTTESGIHRELESTNGNAGDMLTQLLASADSRCDQQTLEKQDWKTGSAGVWKPESGGERVERESTSKFQIL